MALGPIIFIHPDSKDDKSLEEHEQEHARQCWRDWVILWIIKYLFVHDYRLKMEVGAYRRQLQFPPASNNPDAVKMFATWISKKYRLKITAAEAVTLLEAE